MQTHTNSSILVVDSNENSLGDKSQDMTNCGNGNLRDMGEGVLRN